MYSLKPAMSVARGLVDNLTCDTLRVSFLWEFIIYVCVMSYDCSVGGILCSMQQPVKVATLFEARIIVFNIDIPITSGYSVRLFFFFFFVSMFFVSLFAFILYVIYCKYYYMYL